MSRSKQDPLEQQCSAMVRKRDKNRCRACNRFTKRGHSHHLDCYSRYPNLRYELLNLVLLCPTCHYQFHEQYGKLHTTREQFINWLWLKFRKRL